MAQQLRAATPDAFELHEVLPQDDCVVLDYRDYDGTTVRTKFWFDDAGHISRTSCMPLGGLGSRAA